MSLEWHNHMSVFNFSLRNAKSVSKNSRLCERHALENSKPSYWAIKMINLLERNPLWRRHIPFWHCATWEVLFFPPTALPTTAQVQPVSQIRARVSLPAERALRDRVFAQCGFLRSASTKARLAALFHWNHFFPLTHSYSQSPSVMAFHQRHICDPMQISTKEPSLSLIECNGVYLFQARELSGYGPRSRREKMGERKEKALLLCSFLLGFYFLLYRANIKEPLSGITWSLSGHSNGFSKNWGGRTYESGFA